MGKVGSQFLNGLNAFETLVDLLRQRAQDQPYQETYEFLTEGDEVASRLSNQDLSRQAQVIGAQLQAHQAYGERVLLLFPPGLSYIAAFFGCLYAGAVAVPAYPPRPNRSMSRLKAIAKDAQPKIVLTTSKLLADLRARGDYAFAEDLIYIATDGIDQTLACQWQVPSIDGDSLALLQYTSGSTAAPKGVMVSHRNLLHNLGLICENFSATPHSRGVIWLPPYHDMGLVGGILQPLYVGLHVALIVARNLLIAFNQRMGC